MKTIFIDCNDQLDAVFARVHRAGDPAIVVNTQAFERTALPRVLAGYDICVDDHSYMPTELVAQCPALKHIVFLGTGASSYMDVPSLNALGVTVHTIKGYGDIAVATQKGRRDVETDGEHKDQYASGEQPGQRKRQYDVDEGTCG